MSAIDTNILFYAHDPRDPDKQRISSDLIATLPDGTLIWQVACEYLSATRKLEPFGYSYEHAIQDVADLRRLWKVVLPTWAVLERSEALKAAYSLSFWDRLLIATCLEAGVRRLFSEDFSGYDYVESLEIVNPFDRM